MQKLDRITKEKFSLEISNSLRHWLLQIVAQGAFTNFVITFFKRRNFFQATVNAWSSTIGR